MSALFDISGISGVLAAGEVSRKDIGPTSRAVDPGVP